MVYTQEEKAKMDILLQVFQFYLERQEDYEVFYSRKAGYLRVLTGESCDAIYFPITGFADMLQMFTQDLLAEGNPTGFFLEQDYDRVRSLLTPKLDALGKHREEAHRIMEDTFQICRSQCSMLRQKRLEHIHQLEELLHTLHASLSESE